MVKHSDQVWFMVASDTAASFRWEHILHNHGTVFFWLRKLPKNFKIAQEGDLILCYRSGSSQRALVGLARVEEEFNDDGITVRGLCAFKQPIPYDIFKNDRIYKNTEAGRLRNRGTLFAVNHEFTHWVKNELNKKEDRKPVELIDKYLIH